MDKAFIIDTRTNVFTVKEAEVIEIVDMVLKCRVDGEVFKVRRGNYFETKKRAEEKLEEIKKQQLKNLIIKKNTHTQTNKVMTMINGMQLGIKLLQITN